MDSCWIYIRFVSNNGYPLGFRWCFASRICMQEGYWRKFVSAPVSASSYGDGHQPCYDPLPLRQAESTFKAYPSPVPTYEEVIANPKLFMESLEKLHSSMRTKFMVPTIGGKELDLHRLFVEVTSRGGLERFVVINLGRSSVGAIQFILWTGSSWIKNSGSNFQINLQLLGSKCGKVVQHSHCTLQHHGISGLKMVLFVI